jgi:hypothetical protein
MLPGVKCDHFDGAEALVRTPRVLLQVRERGRGGMGRRGSRVASCASDSSRQKGDAKQRCGRAGSREHRRPAAGDPSPGGRDPGRQPHGNELVEGSPSAAVPARLHSLADTEAAERCVPAQADSRRQTPCAPELGAMAWRRLWDLLLFGETSRNGQ